MLILDLPSELLDTIIDELRHDKRSMLRASLACRAFYPRTRIYLFLAVTLYTKYSCDRLRNLLALSPKLAPHFKFLEINYLHCNTLTPDECRALTVVDSLVNVTHLCLRMGDWRAMPDFVVSSLQSHSYHSLIIDVNFKFRTIGEICSLVKNSPNLKMVYISTPPQCGITEDCNLDHSLHSIPAPVSVRIAEFLAVSTGIIQKSVLSSSPCPFSGSNIHTLAIEIDATVHHLPQDLNQYLSRSKNSLKHLRVTHPISRFGTASSETLHISGIEQITVAVEVMDRASHVLEWWISNLAAVNEHCAIRSITFTLLAFDEPDIIHPALAWKDLWTRLDGRLTSRKMALFERAAIAFYPRPAEWDALKTCMEGDFVGLKQLGCEVALIATSRLSEYFSQL